MSMKLYELCGDDRALLFSPYCWRARMALAHKGLTFDSAPTPFTEVPAIEGGSCKSVPVLNDSGTIVRDSFDIAVYLEGAYTDRPPLFGHAGVVAAARLVETWVKNSIHPVIMRIMVKDIHDQLGPADKAYFRESRERMLGKSLGEAQTGHAANAEAFAAALSPARRAMEENDWLGGATPLYTDYILFGSLNWLFTITGRLALEPDDAVAVWFYRCLDLHDGLARRAKRAA